MNDAFQVHFNDPPVIGSTHAYNVESSDHVRQNYKFTQEEHPKPEHKGK